MYEEPLCASLIPLPTLGIGPTHHPPHPMTTESLLLVSWGRSGFREEHRRGTVCVRLWPSVPKTGSVISHRVRGHSKDQIIVGDRRFDVGRCWGYFSFQLIFLLSLSTGNYHFDSPQLLRPLYEDTPPKPASPRVPPTYSLAPAVSSEDMVTLSSQLLSQAKVHD